MQEPIYPIVSNPDDPVVTVRLSESMLKDLVARAEENGRDIQVEIAMRLARSLERDFERDAEDAVIAALISGDLKAIWSH